MNNMSDMFHENVDDETLDTLFAVMAKADHHQFQVLTKRPERMMYFSMKFDIPSNVWMGVSVEDVATVQRLDILQQVKADVRFVSAEPLLADISDEMFKHLKWLDWVSLAARPVGPCRPMDICGASALGRTVR